MRKPVLIGFVAISISLFFTIFVLNAFVAESADWMSMGGQPVTSTEVGEFEMNVMVYLLMAGLFIIIDIVIVYFIVKA